MKSFQKTLKLIEEKINYYEAIVGKCSNNTVK